MIGIIHATVAYADQGHLATVVFTTLDGSPILPQDLIDALRDMATHLEGEPPPVRN